MKRLLSTIIIMFWVCSLYGQISCYDETRSKGIAFFNANQYENAIKAFTTAKSCPDKPQDNDLDSWISKCKTKLTPPPAKVDTYIKVAGKSSIISNHSSSGGTATFNVSTDAKSWSVWGVPSWCSIENKTSSSFRLRVSANTSTSERTDYMEVRTPKGHSAKINIRQESKKIAEPSARIENVTVEHNQKLNDGKGMVIHVKFHIQNMKERKGQIVAYFYDNNGNELIGGNERHCILRKNVTPRTNNSLYSDFKLSIPYRKLHQTGSMSGTLKFCVTIWDTSVSPHKEILRGSKSWFSFVLP